MALCNKYSVKVSVHSCIEWYKRIAVKKGYPKA